MTDEVWDYIFLGATLPASCPVNREAVARLRREFIYWYPFDLRVSGKDLVPNHLTYSLYNHVAIWPRHPSLWPRAVRANGHLLLNSEKMSKSTGNFLTLTEAIDKYSADGMRLALADAGDGIEDANFDEVMADAGLLRLYTFVEWVREVAPELAKAEEEQEEDRSTARHCDKVFEAAMNDAIERADRAYEQMLFKEAVKAGFYEFQGIRDRYREVSLGVTSARLMRRYVETQLLMLAPVCTHVCDYLWREVLGKPNSVLCAPWPSTEWRLTEPKEAKRLLLEGAFLDEATHDFRLRLKTYLAPPRKGKGAGGDAQPPVPPTHASVRVAQRYPTWQAAVLDTLLALYE